MWSVRCGVCSVRCGVCSVECAGVECVVWSVRCAVCGVECAVWSVQMWSVWCGSLHVCQCSPPNLLCQPSCPLFGLHRRITSPHVAGCEQQTGKKEKRTNSIVQRCCSMKCGIRTYTYHNSMSTQHAGKYEYTSNLHPQSGCRRSVRHATHSNPNTQL